MAAAPGSPADDTGSDRGEVRVWAEGMPSPIAHDALTIEVAVIAFYGPSLTAVAEEIENALRTLIGERRLTVTIEDLDTSPRAGRDSGLDEG